MAECRFDFDEPAQKKSGLNVEEESLGPITQARKVGVGGHTLDNIAVTIAKI